MAAIARRLVLSAVMLGAGACGGALPVVGHDQVCRAGYQETGGEERDVATCAPGLRCCYPCGVDGCSSVCHTPEECEVDDMSI